MSNKKNETKPGLRVRAVTAGFRRAGRAWPAEPVEVPRDAFADDQVKALKGEPMIVVEEIEIPVPEGVPAEGADLAAAKKDGK